MMTGSAQNWSLSWTARIEPPRRITAEDSRGSNEGVEFRFVWPDPPAAVRADVIALWHRLDALPPRVDTDRRAGEVCVVGYKDGALVAICSTELTMAPRLAQRFAMIRVLVAPEHRSFHMMWALIRVVYDCLSAWSLRTPQEKIMGLGAIIQAPSLGPLARRPAWPIHPGDPMNSGLVLIGHTERGEQIRVAWFDHARV